MTTDARLRVSAAELLRALCLALAILMGAAAPASSQRPSQAGTPAPLAYAPTCTTAACEIWARYRRERPFPIQTMAGAPGGGAYVLILTEPALPRAQLETSIREIFGRDVAAIETRRWMIGVDGWLEDMIVTLRQPTTGAALDNVAFRDRLSLLAEDLWSTSFGLYVEDAAASWRQQARAAAPNLEIGPSELRSWLLDPGTRWLDAAGEARTFQQLSAARASGTFVSSSNDLAIFIIDGASIGRGDISALRGQFREFAIVTDTLVGSIWGDQSGNLALVGRARQTPVASMPPLRFETLQVLAAQADDALAQSYERTTPFAGKMPTGAFEGADWAPIYLSHDLIDTEYGALLNITDQMLKSWSQAGEVQYIYFDYPLRPADGRFAFGGRSLASILKQETNATGVLFNWNTAGAAAIVSDGGWSTLTPTRTGSLPVTYGSELEPGAGMRVGEGTQQHEDTAYAFFSSLQDPNLARVVAYATIYQAFRANPRAAHVQAPGEARTSEGRQAAQRSQAGTEYLSARVADMLGYLERGEIPPGGERAMAHNVVLIEAARRPEIRNHREFRNLAANLGNSAEVRAAAAETVNEARRAINQFKAAFPQYGANHELARLLIDRARLPTLQAQLNRRADAVRRTVGAYNEDVDAFNAARLLTTDPRAIAEKRRLERETARIEAEQAAVQVEFDRLNSLSEAVGRLQSALSPAFTSVSDIGAVRTGFMSAHGAPSTGWIRTPSIVLSWDEHSMSVGGHNLDARALRVEAAPGVSAPRVVETPTGPVLRVPPSMARAASANANRIARMIEHGRLGEAHLTRQLAALTPPPSRPRAEALALTRSQPAFVGRGGARALEDAAVRTAHLEARQILGASAVVAIRSPENGAIIVSTRNGATIRCCTRMEDYASFRQLAADATRNGGDIILSGFSEGQASALAINLSGGRRTAVAEALSRRTERRSGGIDLAFLAAEPPRASGAPGPGQPRSFLSVFIEGGGDNSRQVLAATNRQRTFSTPQRLSDADAAALVRSRQAAEGSNVSVFRITSSETDPAAQFEAHVVAELDPAQRAAGQQLAERAISEATANSTTLLNLAAEARRIIGADSNPSSVRSLMFWARESGSNFSVTDTEREAGGRRG